ncbi:MAG TPA: metal-sensitive transcriptional regulator [Nitrospirae bacterium]|nr:metal-sensitive transcriptional regulator [Nitrospirota bacterium]
MKENKVDILNRLKKIEGQIRGLQRMIYEGRRCEEIFSQMSAVEGAIKKVSLIMAEHYIDECTKDSALSREEMQNNLSMVLKTIKRSL